MAKTSADYEKEFIATAMEKTGKTLEQWLAVIKPEGFSKQTETLNWLKKEHKLNHMQAALLAGIFLNNGKPVYQDESNLIENQLLKSESIRPLFDVISKKILKVFPDSQMIAKKTYISFSAKREFAAINIKATELRLGMDLGDIPFNDKLQKSKMTGPMPRISHMVIIRNDSDLDEQLIDLLETSYRRVNK